MRNKNPILIMSLLVALIIVFGAGSYVFAAGWLSNGDNVYYNDGNVGIGTSNPNRNLVVRDNDSQAEISLQSDESSILNIDSTHAGGGTTNLIGFKDNQYTKASWYYSTAGNFMGYRNIFQNDWDKPILSFNDSGKVGLNDSNPDFSLEVAEKRGEAYFGISTDINNFGDIFMVNKNGKVNINNNYLTDNELNVFGNIAVTSGNDICVKNDQCLSEIWDGSIDLSVMNIEPTHPDSDAIILISPLESNRNSVLSLNSTHSGGGTTNSIHFRNNNVLDWLLYYSTAGNFLGIRQPGQAWNQPIVAFNDHTGGFGVNESSPDYAFEVATAKENYGYFQIHDGSLVFRINSDGNVAINRNNRDPLEKMDIDGNIKIASGSDVCIKDGNCLSTAVGNVIDENVMTIKDGIEIDSTESSVLQLDSTHVGGGTTNALSFADSEKMKWLMYYSTAGNFVGMRSVDRAWNDPNLTFNDSKRVGINEVSPDFAYEIVGDMGISSASDNDGDVMVVSGGKVGIGVSEPGEALEVDGNMKVGGNVEVQCIGACGAE